MRINVDDSDSTEIGFAPLIDCIFLLLIFFLVATSFKTQEENKKQVELPVDLPSSTASFNISSASETPIVLGVDIDGDFYWGTTKVSVGELREKLKDAKNATPNRRIRIDGDRLTAYQNIVHLLDICQFEGFTNIGVHTRK